MKKGIHKEETLTKFVCACGNVIEANSTIKGDTYQIETCSACHPFYTNNLKVEKTGGRAEKFKKKFGIQ